MKNINKSLLLLAFIFTAPALWAANGGTVAVPFLKMDMGARYYGMAGAATAFGDDVTAMTFYNPAAAGSVQAFQITGTTFENAVDMKHHYAGLALPIPFLSTAGNKPMTAGFSFFMFDKGDLDDNGVSRAIGDDMAFTVTLGENVATHMWDFIGESAEANHYVGVNFKYIRSTLPLPGTGDVTGESFAFDAGYRMTLDNHFGVGIAARNIGRKIKYIEERDPLPSTLSVGAFITVADIENIRWDLSSDYIYHMEEEESRIRIGTEAVFFDILAVRGGVKLLEELDEEYTLGFGLRLLGFEVDFGTVLNQQLNDDNIYQISVSYKFPVKKTDDKYKQDKQKRNDYQDYKQREAARAQEKAERNTNPILYQ